MSALSDAVPDSAEDTKRAREAENLRLEPHVCRHCFGRVASRKIDAGVRHYVCTNCGVEAEGHKPAVICACGMKLRKRRGDGRSSEVLIDAGIRCHENRRRSPEFPSLFTASHGGAQVDE